MDSNEANQALGFGSFWNLGKSLAKTAGPNRSTEDILKLAWDETVPEDVCVSLLAKSFWTKRARSIKFVL